MTALMIRETPAELERAAARLLAAGLGCLTREEALAEYEAALERLREVSEEETIH